MFSTKAFTILALVALSTSSVSARQLLQTGTCPLPADSNPDLSGLVGPCGNNATICTTCLCSLITALVPAYVAGGVTFDPQNPGDFDFATVSEISQACAQSLAPQLSAALGSKASALAGLTECPLVADSTSGNLTAASLPSCLTVEALTAAFAAANTTGTLVNATLNGTANATTTGMTMDMTNSTTDGDNTTSVVATQGPADSTTASTPTASPAAAPATKAPGNSAATVGTAVMTTIGAAVLATLLL